VKFAVVTFPGSNCDFDAYAAVVEGLGEEADYVWHKDTALGGADVVILPGGFSYGDYLRAGAIARFSPIMQAVAEHARRGGPVLAICNGFQIACEAGLLPGALARNAELCFISERVWLRVENATSDFTSAYAARQLISVPIAHGEGRYVADEATLDRLEGEGRVAFRYASAEGETSDKANVNGSSRHIAGILNDAGNVLGMMPHPERAVDALLGRPDGLPLFESLLARVSA
jgi:phosphoribosylformylglycinamidine synthase subunit PurQ / glutaminase